MTVKDRTCKVCGRTVLGRADKKYCSSECRSENHNQKNKESGGLVKKVNSILRKNRRILKSLNPSGTRVLPKKKLLESGFSFSYYTNTYQTKKGKIYFFIYDQGYILLDNDEVALVSRHDYVE